MDSEQPKTEIVGDRLSDHAIDALADLLIGLISPDEPDEKTFAGCWPDIADPPANKKGLAVANRPINYRQPDKKGQSRDEAKLAQRLEPRETDHSMDHTAAIPARQRQCPNCGSTQLHLGGISIDQGPALTFVSGSRVVTRECASGDKSISVLRYSISCVDCFAVEHHEITSSHGQVSASTVLVPDAPAIPLLASSLEDSR